MKLKMETPMASAPIVAAESSPQCPAMAVLTMPMRGTVMFDTMFGMAIRNISRFIFMVRLRFGGKDTALPQKWQFDGRISSSPDARKRRTPQRVRLGRGRRAVAAYCCNDWSSALYLLYLSIMPSSSRRRKLSDLR